MLVSVACSVVALVLLSFAGPAAPWYGWGLVSLQLVGSVAALFVAMRAPHGGADSSFSERKPR
ncbi:MAG TPA: hypothetical protein VIP11_12640 [Gemmatimonadaceae bacterium]